MAAVVDINNTSKPEAVLPLYSIICPFYNERDNLKEMYARLTKTMRQLESTYEIIFINDGSDDGSEDLLHALIRFDPLVQIATLPRSGKTIALDQGLRAARGAFLITIDSDLQNPPEEIPKLISLLNRNDLVLGVRENRKDPMVKKIVGALANALRRALLGDHIQDSGCALRVFNRNVLSSFNAREGMLRYFPAIAERQGFRIAQVPVAHDYRRHGKSKYRTITRLWVSLAVLPSVFKTINSTHRSQKHFKANPL